MQLFVDQLTNVDFSYLDESRGLVGETWLANFALEGELDQQSMVCDFGIVKKTFRKWLDETLDHKLLVPKHSASLSITTSNGITQLTWQSVSGEITMSAPEDAITLVDGDCITPETLAAWCQHQALQLMPKTVLDIDVSFETEHIPGYFYQYSHGLKKHDGNCQRIAHGHRSTINICKNGRRDFELERAWCEKWRDIYIGTEEDIIDDINGIYKFAYEAPQGRFELSLPKNNCYIIQTDSTVEQIAQHIAQVLKSQFPEDTIQVKAFEGIGKGALVSL
ncbi:6-carboxytetrahydropterin synthase [Sessilibacter sp. MAH1]